MHRLHELALDLWWSWDDRARAVFRALDYTLWRATAHNPVQMLQRITPERLAAAAADPDFLKAYDEAMFGLDQARTVAHPWWRDKQSMLGDGSIAYFSAEFALHQSLPIYAGGLGVLAGDHCKEAADLGLPFVGIGFMYPQGYFRQRMTDDGWQQERYERISWTDAPIEAAITPDGRPCVTAVPLGERTVLWRHVLRNALVPVITVVGLELGTLLSGSIIVETVFSWPGSGSLLISAIQSRDYPLITGTVLTYTVAFVVINFAIDILYALIDPRIRFGQ